MSGPERERGGARTRAEGGSGCLDPACDRRRRGARGESSEAPRPAHGRARRRGCTAAVLAVGALVFGLQGGGAAGPDEHRRVARVGGGRRVGARGRRRAATRVAASTPGPHSTSRTDAGHPSPSPTDAATAPLSVRLVLPANVEPGDIRRRRGDRDERRRRDGIGHVARLPGIAVDDDGVAGLAHERAPAARRRALGTRPGRVDHAARLVQTRRCDAGDEPLEARVATDAAATSRRAAYAGASRRRVRRSHSGVARRARLRRTGVHRRA